MYCRDNLPDRAKHVSMTTKKKWLQLVFIIRWCTKTGISSLQGKHIDTIHVPIHTQGQFKVTNPVWSQMQAWGAGAHPRRCGHTMQTPPRKAPLLHGRRTLPIKVRSSISAGVSCRSVLRIRQADSQRRGARLPVTSESFPGALMLARATAEHRSKSAGNTQAREQLPSNKELLGRLLSLSPCSCSVDYWGSRLQSSLQHD